MVSSLTSTGRGLQVRALTVPRRAYDVSLDVPPGTITVLVGPTGSGKSTVLAGVAGLLRASGSVLIDGRDVSALRPQERPSALVAQNPALFSAMSVRENVGFGLDDVRMPEPTRNARITITMADLGISDLADLRPDALSGGQRQRVALARALAIRPRVLLLDEPLSHIDYSRHLIQRELVAQVRRHAMSCIYVTHDLDEACQVADELLVLRTGRVVQRGSPQEVFERPVSRFVARTMGVPNYFACRVTEVDGPWRTVELAPGHAYRVAGDAPLGEALVAILPTAVRLTPCAAQSSAADHLGHGQVIRALYSRTHMRYDIETTFGTIVVEDDGPTLAPATWVCLDITKAWVTRTEEETC